MSNEELPDWEKRVANHIANSEPGPLPAFASIEDKLARRRPTHWFHSRFGAALAGFVLIAGWLFVQTQVTGPDHEYTDYEYTTAFDTSDGPAMAVDRRYLTVVLRAGTPADEFFAAHELRIETGPGALGSYVVSAPTAAINANLAMLQALPEIELLQPTDDGPLDP